MSLGRSALYIHFSLSMLYVICKEEHLRDKERGQDKTGTKRGARAACFALKSYRNGGLLSRALLVGMSRDELLRSVQLYSRNCQRRLSALRFSSLHSLFPLPYPLPLCRFLPLLRRPSAADIVMRNAEGGVPYKVTGAAINCRFVECWTRSWGAGGTPPAGDGGRAPADCQGRALTGSRAEP